MKRGWDVDDLVDDVDVDVDVDEGRLTGSPVWWGAISTNEGVRVHALRTKAKEVLRSQRPPPHSGRLEACLHFHSHLTSPLTDVQFTIALGT